VAAGIGLDSLDFIELGIAVEERFAVPMDESEDLMPHFASLDTLCRFIAARAIGMRHCWASGERPASLDTRRACGIGSAHPPSINRT
jgi:hypothetical protein